MNVLQEAKDIKKAIKLALAKAKLLHDSIQETEGKDSTRSKTSIVAKNV